jgi:hypothetical protein
LVKLVEIFPHYLHYHVLRLEWNVIVFKIGPAITNYNRVKNITDNRHGIVGYLNDVTVARCVAEALGN